MTDKSFSNELQRVLARPDADKLERNLDDYRRYMAEIAANEPNPGEYGTMETS